MPFRRPIFVAKKPPSAQGKYGISTSLVGGGGTTVEGEFVCDVDLAKPVLVLTIAQGLVFGIYLALVVYSTCTILGLFSFAWLTFGLWWGCTALFLQAGHCLTYFLFRRQVRAPVGGDSGTRPAYLVGSAVLRDVQVGVLISSFSWLVFVYLVIMMLASQGISGPIEHTIELPFVILFTFIGFGAMFAMVPAITAQMFPVTNMKHLYMRVDVPR